MSPEPSTSVLQTIIKQLQLCNMDQVFINSPSKHSSGAKTQLHGQLCCFSHHQPQMPMEPTTNQHTIDNAISVGGN